MAALTEKTARFIFETTLAQMPPECLAKAKYHLIDYMAVTLAGSAEEPSRIIRDYTQAAGTQGHSLILGTAVRVRAEEAALVNGVQAHVLDYDDVNQSMCGHPSAAVLPAALAVAEEAGCSGRQLLEAYILGVEIAGKLGRVMNPRHYELGWHATCTLGSLGAAAAAAKILGLEPAKIRMALGLAASLAGGLKVNFGTMTKSYHAGRAAENGLRAVRLVQRGWDACDYILDDPAWFARPFLGDSACDLASIGDMLGRPYDILSPGIIVKKYPSCAFTHPAIDALQQLMAEQAVAVEAVEEIVVTLHQMADQVLIHRRAATGLEGKFCIEYCLASTLALGGCGLKNFTEASVARPEVQALSARVQRKVARLPSQAGNVFGPSQVEIRLQDGGSRQATVEVAKGDPGNPLPDAEMRQKYLECAAVVYSQERAERIFQALQKIDEVQDLRQLMDGLLPG